MTSNYTFNMTDSDLVPVGSSTMTTPLFFVATTGTDGDRWRPKRTVWNSDELLILGGFLWIAIIITLVGNLACFYAVWKNLKKILEHPFFQSNVFCVYLSFIDILLVVLVGIPAAICFTTDSPSLRDGIYNL